MQFQHLRHLYMDGQGKSNLRYLSRCSNLETLSISWAEFFNDSFLASIRVIVIMAIVADFDMPVHMYVSLRKVQGFLALLVVSSLCTQLFLYHLGLG